jgi:hypothetical protein
MSGAGWSNPESDPLAVISSPRIALSLPVCAAGANINADDIPVSRLTIGISRAFGRGDTGSPTIIFSLISDCSMSVHSISPSLADESKYRGSIRSPGISGLESSAAQAQPERQCEHKAPHPCESLRACSLLLLLCCPDSFGAGKKTSRGILCAMLDAMPFPRRFGFVILRPSAVFGLLGLFPFLAVFFIHGQSSHEPLITPGAECGDRSRPLRHALWEMPLRNPRTGSYRGTTHKIQLPHPRSRARWNQMIPAIGSGVQKNNALLGCGTKIGWFRCARNCGRPSSRPRTVALRSHSCTVCDRLLHSFFPELSLSSLSRSLPVSESMLGGFPVSAGSVNLNQQLYYAIIRNQCQANNAIKMKLFLRLK